MTIPHRVPAATTRRHQTGAKLDRLATERRSQQLAKKKMAVRKAQNQTTRRRPGGDLGERYRMKITERSSLPDENNRLEVDLPGRSMASTSWSTPTDQRNYYGVQGSRAKLGYYGVFRARLRRTVAHHRQLRAPKPAMRCRTHHRPLPTLHAAAARLRAHVPVAPARQDAVHRTRIRIARTSS